MKELEKKRIILAYKVHLNPKALGRIACKALIYLKNTTKKELQSFLNSSSTLPGVVWPQRVMGAWDYEIDFELESYEQFQNIMLELKERHPSILKNYDFCITRKEWKLDLYPNAFKEISL